MKTRLYTLITGLLMAVCITSYGQEIVSEFVINYPNYQFNHCNLFENEDGTLLFETTADSIHDGGYKHLFLKITPEGEVLDSLALHATGDYSHLFRNPIDNCSYILTEGIINIDEIDSIMSGIFTIYFIDADLNLFNEIAVPVIEFPLGTFEHFYWRYCFIDSQNDFIIYFWTDNVFHLMRIGLDGTIKASNETDALFEPNYSNPTSDTTLLYSEMGYGVFSTSPLTYYLLGGFSPASGPWPIYVYFFDADLNITGSHLYEQFDENIAFDGGNVEHFVPLDENSYLTATQIKRLTPAQGGVGLSKLDMNHNPICVSPLFGTNHCFPHQTVIANSNMIYQLYDMGGGYSPNKIGLARLDSNLNLDWDVTLPTTQLYAWLGSDMVILKNGDIVIGSICKRSSRYCAIIITLHDDYDNTPEKANANTPFVLYPNPVKDAVTLTFTEGNEPTNVEVYDLTGRLMATKTKDLERLDMSAMPVGVYMLRVTMKDGSSYNKKILKE